MAGSDSLAAPPLPSAPIQGWEWAVGHHLQAFDPAPAGPAPGGALLPSRASRFCPASGTPLGLHFAL